MTIQDLIQYGNEELRKHFETPEHKKLINEMAEAYLWLFIELLATVIVKAQGENNDNK